MLGLYSETAYATANISIHPGGRKIRPIIGPMFCPQFTPLLGKYSVTPEEGKCNPYALYPTVYSAMPLTITCNNWQNKEIKFEETSMTIAKLMDARLNNLTLFIPLFSLR